MTEDSSLSAKRPGHTPARGSVDQSAEPHFLAVGRISKPHGVRGEVRVELMTDTPERFKWLDTIYIGEVNPRQVAIDSVRVHQGGVLLRLAGYPTRTEAEQLRGELLLVPKAEAVPLEEGEYFLYQLDGLAVYTVSGTYIGRLVEVLETGANNVFVVDGPLGQHLLPDIPDVIKEIDIEGGRIVIMPLPGLIDGLDE
ncbi:MAG: ribosome maturation factor RimM [Anaerolineae bacterium]|nr:16S rRNA processing protein RimM [Promineifilum sp.]MCZ2114048.1 ribosome maturation factor RimM [Anaerolineae bacterium]